MICESAESTAFATDVVGMIFVILRIRGASGCLMSATFVILLLPGGSFGKHDLVARRLSCSPSHKPTDNSFSYRQLSGL